MSANTLLDLRVRALRWEAEGILSIELDAPGDAPLPPFEAGAHIDLHLPDGGPVRSYSLLNDPSERHRYQVAVHRHPASRGGSRWLHESLRCGQRLAVGTPRNNFPLDESAALSVLFAGGIGITPLLGMVRRLGAIGRPWRLHYASRGRAHAAFVPELLALARSTGGELSLHFDDERGGPLDLPGLVAALPPTAHVYCCGPLPMLEAFEQATAAWAPERVHREYFTARESAATDGGFTVEAARSGRRVRVQPGQTILDALMGIGIEPMYSCREGICGTCEVGVIAGVPDPRDLVLTEAERAAGRRILVCCSGSKSDTLVLDL
jgi:tetrachlorobenzoquinone reductase